MPRIPLTSSRKRFGGRSSVALQILQNSLSIASLLEKIGNAGMQPVNANQGATEHALLHFNRSLTK